MSKSEKEANSQVNPRAEVFRDTLVLQLKLIVDGLRDLVLMPVCLVASLWGLVRHSKNPGRYLYRVLSYGKLSEKWIGLFDEAKKDPFPPLTYDERKFDDLLDKTQQAFESKYIDPEKKANLVRKLDLALNEINGKLSTSTKKKPASDK